MNGRQQGLFDPPAPPWEETPSQLYAEIVFNRPVRSTYTYAVPDPLIDRILAGKRVECPFGKGNRKETGYCVGVTDSPPQGTKLKSVLSVLDDEALISPAMLHLTKWIAEYYFCGWGQVLDAVVPHAVRTQSGTRWTVLLTPLIVPEDQLAKLTPKQRNAYESLVEIGRPASIEEIASGARVGRDVVKALVAKAVAQSKRVRVQHKSVDVGTATKTVNLTLNSHQQVAYDRIADCIDRGEGRTFLLHGVTGSGKTEVYLQSIAEAVRRRREAIVLVPEISLTPQTIERFRGRFDEVAILHSHLTDVERHWHWQRIRAGKVQVVVGARSAIFAPCQNLGLVVIDEEHENTFKQETTPRYHARDVAIERARRESIPLVLGSATPSLESWVAAQGGRFELLSLPERVGDMKLPDVACIDLRQEYSRKRGMTALSPSLVRAMGECIHAGGQVILLLNRRGFAPSIVCPQCGHVEKCQHCDIAMTFHKQRHRAICHSCDVERPVPRECSECKRKELRLIGFGTQRLEDEVKARFPDARCQRMDSDTMRSALHYERVLSAFRQGDIDILLGTQMIAKGLDFPNVRLVGVVSADTARNLPDFRAAEKTFQLIVQVAGRAGRGQDPGRVLVQTFDPDDSAIQAAAQCNYHRFVAEELPLRREFHYPPYGKLTRVIVRAKEEDAARDGGVRIAEKLQDAAKDSRDVQILGPAPCPAARLRDYFRYHLQIHTPDARCRETLLSAALDGLSLAGSAEFVVDVDPMDLL